jgi:hypothetical protein
MKQGLNRILKWMWTMDTMVHRVRVGGRGKKGETDGENKYENQKEKKDNEGSDQPNHLSYGAKQTDSLQEVQPTVENDNKGTHSQGRS